MSLQSTSEQVEDVEVSHIGPSNLWAWASDGYLWIHCNFVIHVLPKINSRFVTTFPTPKLEVPITVSPYIN